MAKVDPKIYKKKRYFKTHKLKRALPMFVGVILVFLSVWGLNPGGIRTRANVEVSGKPELKADRELVDLGDIKLGKTTTVAFEVTNVGDQTLKFTKAPYIEVVEGC